MILLIQWVSETHISHQLEKLDTCDIKHISLRQFTQTVVSEYICLYTFEPLIPSDFTSPHRDVYLEGKEDIFSQGYRCVIHMPLHPTHSLFSTCRHAMLLVLPTAVWESSNRNLHHSLVLSSAVFICCHCGVAATYTTLAAEL